MVRETYTHAVSQSSAARDSHQQVYTQRGRSLGFPASSRRVGSSRRQRSSASSMGSRSPLALAALLSLLAADRAFAQVDLTGTWRPLARNEDGSGRIGDAAGFPLPPPSRVRARKW